MVKICIMCGHNQKELTKMEQRLSHGMIRLGIMISETPGSVCKLDISPKLFGEELKE